MATRKLGPARPAADPAEQQRQARAVADPAELAARPALVGTGIGLRGPGTGSPWRWFFSAIWLIYLIQPVADLFDQGPQRAVSGRRGLAIASVFGVLYV